MLSDSPNAFSLGRLCVLDGFGFQWDPKSHDPVLTLPSGDALTLPLQHYVPVLTPEIIAFIVTKMSPQSEAQSACLPAPAVDQPVVVVPPAHEALVPHLDPQSTAHLVSHRPALRNCPICQQAKQKQAQARRTNNTATEHAGKQVATRFGESIGADHIIFGRACAGVNSETVCLVLRDSATNVAECCPSRSKGTEESESAYRHFTDLDNARELRSDNSPELIAVAKNCGLRHKTATPYRPQSHATDERFNQTVLSDGRTYLLQSGLDVSYWPYALRYAAFVHNVCPHLGVEHTPWFALHNKEFAGALIPFGSEVFVAVAPEYRDHKADPGGRPHVFLGYFMQPRMTWSGEFLTVEHDLLRRGEHHLNRTMNLRVPQAPWQFPTQKLRNEAHLAQWQANHHVMTLDEYHETVNALEDVNAVDIAPLEDAAPPAPAPAPPPAPQVPLPDQPPEPFRQVRPSAGSTRPPYIDPDVWRTFGPSVRKKQSVTKHFSSTQP